MSEPDFADADLQRRFGGLRRLYGDTGYARVRAARVAVVGLGGVGSWAVEALARSGVAQLVLIDLDHVAESNINRQAQATSATLGQHKGQALRERIAAIHPGCNVQVVDAFVDADNWPALLPAPVDALIDACDQVRAKLAMATWSLHTGVPLVCVGAAGGKRAAQRVEVEDLADVTHDPLLASLRQRLRQQGMAPKVRGDSTGKTGKATRIGVRCVFSRESVALPVATARVPVPVSATATGMTTAGSTATAADGDHNIDEGALVGAATTDGSLNCSGYGSSVTVTATFGMVAAGEAIALLLAPPPG